MPEVLTATVPPLKTVQPLKTSYRINSIDMLRGLVMIIMALDHCRDFFHKEAWTDDPTNLLTTTPFLFFTRWITHLCAPTFVFLTGASAWFQSLRKTKKELSAFLITRGLWLILIEITVVTFSFSFDPHFSIIGLQTIWSIGISMVILGLVIWLPFTAIFILGSIIVFGHNSLDYYERTLKADPAWWYHFLHLPGFFRLSATHTLAVLYPFLSWSGLMMLGYCFGNLFLRFEGMQRKKMIFWLSIGVLTVFVVLRLMNGYGDPDPWSKQKNSVFTFLSFMNVHKYPPSLLYMCATIGISLLFLAFAGKGTSALAKFITVYGRVPFFYYIIHFYLIHTICAILFLARGHSFAEGVHPNSQAFLPNFILPHEGYSLWVVYAVWIFVVLSLYPLCKWFSDYKLQHQKEKKWLSYL